MWVKTSLLKSIDSCSYFIGCGRAVKDKRLAWVKNNCPFFSYGMALSMSCFDRRHELAIQSEELDEAYALLLPPEKGPARTASGDRKSEQRRSCGFRARARGTVAATAPEASQRDKWKELQKSVR